MEESTHQNQGRSQTFSLETFARNFNKVAGAFLGGKTQAGCLCLKCSSPELVLLPSLIYKNKSLGAIFPHLPDCLLL